MATLADLLSDSRARTQAIARVSYLLSSVESTEWISQQGWLDPLGGEAGGIYIPGLLATEIRIEQQIDPLEPADAGGAITSLEIINDHQVYAGRYDDWYRASVDDRAIDIFLVGTLGNGTRVELADVIDTPFFSLRGINVPEVGESRVTLHARETTYNLDAPLQPETYSPPALIFPGDSAAAVVLGDVLDITVATSISIWFYTDDPSRGFQYLLHKDGGTTGYYVAAGLVGAGLVSAGVEVAIRGQTPPLSTSAAGVLRANSWHRVDIRLAAASRAIDVDSVTVVSTAGITGSMAGNTVPLTMGNGLLGGMSRVLYWTGSRSNAVMSAEGRIPIVGTEASLLAYFPLNENIGETIYDRKSGSVITGTFDADFGTVWGNADWHYAAIRGEHRPFVLGTVPRVPVVTVDPPKQVMEASYGGLALASEVQSSHNPVSTASYTVNTLAGTFQITSGALSGTYSATVTANNFWNSALLFASTSTALATINSPTGSRTFGIQARADTTAISLRYLIGWQTSANAGSMALRVTTGGGANRLSLFAVNDAAAIFEITYEGGAVEGRTYSYAAQLNLATNRLIIFIDGENVASVAVSGAWTTVRTQFAIGCRPDTGGNSWIGRLDDPWVDDSAMSEADIRAKHLLPFVSTGLSYGWHLDDALTTTTPTTAASALGGTALTLTNVTWTGGRSAAADLARKCYYLAGYTAADLDETSWRQCLNDQPADCGWFVGNGESAIEVAGIILGGLGFIRYTSSGVVYVKRFEGVSGVADVTYNPLIDMQALPIEAGSSDPAVWEWTIKYATNNVKMDQSSIAGSLASSDPDRYSYGAMDARTVTRNDYTIKRTEAGNPGRFPQAVDKTRVTALLHERDAVAELARLLPLHRHASDSKILPMYLLAGSVNALTEIGIDLSTASISDSNYVIIGLTIDGDGLASVIGWRPAEE